MGTATWIVPLTPNTHLVRRSGRCVSLSQGHLTHQGVQVDSSVSHCYIRQTCRGEWEGTRSKVMEMNIKERKGKGKVCLMLSAKNQVTASNVLKPCTQRTNGTPKDGQNIHSTCNFKGIFNQKRENCVISVSPC